MSNSAYSRAAIRRSLVHFAFGKLGSALLGFVLLLVLVRALQRDQYGVYVALLALLEIIQLGTNFGAFSSVYRYVPKYLSTGSGLRLREFVFRLSAYRLTTLCGAAGALWLARDWAAELLQLPAYASLIGLYGLVIVLEGGARFVDLVFDSLLEQARVQIAIMTRNGLRVAGAIVLVSNGANDDGLRWWIWIEVVAAGIGLIVALLMLSTVLNRHAKTSPGVQDHHDFKAIFRFAFYGYISQLGYLAQSADAVRLMVTKVGGAAVSGAFGFTGAIGGMLRRYLPSFLLIGMIRPLFVAHADRVGSREQLVKLADTVFRLNLFVLLPALVCALIVGEPLLNLLSGGKFPEASPFLVAFIVLVGLQSLHAVLELIANAVESYKAPVRSTFLAAFALLSTLAFVPAYGVWALCAGMLASEMVFALAMIWFLRFEGVRYRSSRYAIARLAVLAGAAYGVGMLVNHWLVELAITSDLAVVAIVSMAAVVVFFSLGVGLKPFVREESEMVNGLLPRKLFVW